jgi:hypothetical protein
MRACFSEETSAEMLISLWTCRAETQELRHAFKVHPVIREAVREHVTHAITGLDRRRYQQEATYTAALIHALEGTVYDGPEGSVVFQGTITTDRGRGSAESWSGIDCVITADISNPDATIRKAIVLQAKLGDVEDLAPGERTRLDGQIEKMRRLTASPKIIEYELADGNGAGPFVRSAKRVLQHQPSQRMDLAGYVIRRVLTTLDGDTRPEFVAAVQESGLPDLKVLAKYNNIPIR